MDLGFGVAPSLFFDEVIPSLRKSIPEEYAAAFSFNKNSNLAIRGGVCYERFFKKESPWFWGAGGFVEMDKLSMSCTYQGSKVFGFSVSIIDYCVNGSIGMQSSPNEKGFHFYWKAGAGLGYAMMGNVKVNGYGEASDISNNLSAEDLGGIGGFYGRPYGELGLGNDSFFRFGLRYSPLFGNDTDIPIHSITATITIPIF